MIVCVCEGLSHRVIDRHIDEGVSTVRELGRVTRAGTCCGVCVPALRERLERGRRRADPLVEVGVAAK